MGKDIKDEAEMTIGVDLGDKWSPLCVTSDLNVTYEIKPNKIFKSIVLSGLVNNMFNKEYVSNGYYYNYEDNWTDPSNIQTIEGTGYYPQATINFLLGATFKF